MKPRIAVLDDEARMVDIISIVLRKEGYEVLPFNDSKAFLEFVAEDSVDLLITDLRMPGADGLEVLAGMRRAAPNTPVLLITAHATIDTALAAMREGAFDYVQKPFDNAELLATVARALEHTRLHRENRYLRAQVKSRYALDGIVAESDAMRGAIDLVRRAAQSPATVLVSGESGTGKELIARAVHYYSDRVGGPFLAVNMKSLASGVLESELFGHEKGAFTDAVRTRVGLFEQARGGTIFLDEIGEIDLEFQAKLLRVLQERQLRRVGGTEDLEVDVRVVAATNRDLREEVREGRFREDLYFRLAVIPVHLPPLRERRDDVMPLAKHFLEKWSSELDRPGMDWEADVEAFVERYDWPGNVRELENAIERGVVLARTDTIELADIRLEGTDAPGAAAGDAAMQEAGSLKAFLDAAAAQRIRTILEKCGGVRTDAAKELGVDRATLYRLMRKYGIDDRDA